MSGRLSRTLRAQCQSFASLKPGLGARGPQVAVAAAGRLFVEDDPIRRARDPDGQRADRPDDHDAPPPHTGDDTLNLTLTDASGAPVGDANVTVTPNMLAPREPGQSNSGRAQGNGLYQVPMRLPIATQYDLRVQIEQRNGRPPVTVSFPLEATSNLESKRKTTMVEIDARYEGDKKCSLTHPEGATLKTDAPKDIGGDASAFSPTDLVAAALASCVLTTIAMFAERHGLDDGDDGPRRQGDDAAARAASGVCR